MIKSAKHEPLSNFLSTSDERSYFIPTYQREYAWGKRECEELYDDILDNDDGYFLGSIIWVGSTNEIIDGQQRLTSVSLLLMAIFSKLSQNIDDEELYADKINLKRMIVNKDNTFRLNLQEQNNNKKDYEFLVKNYMIKKGTTPTAPKNFGNRRISANFELFKSLLDDKNDLELINIYRKLCKITFVSIEVENYQSAYQLFEAMNNRGVPLSALDLIKNKFISKGGSIKKWEELINNLGDNYSNQEQFLRNNYNAFRLEYNKLDLTQNYEINVKYSISNKAVRSNIIHIYDKLISDNSDFIDVLIDRSLIYSILLGNAKSPNEKINKILKDFRNANATSAFMLLLFLYNYKNELDLSDDELVSMFSYILKFFIRRNFTNNPSTGAIPQILMDIIDKINRLQIKNYGNINNIIVSVLKEKSSSDAALKEVLEGNLYENNIDMTRYILCSFADDDSSTTAEKKLVDLWEMNSSNKYIWTIEHIFPEGKNIPQPWVDMIADGNRELANEYLKNYVHKIGNLTMTGYNSSLSNKPFLDKKNRVHNDTKQPIGYNNGFILNEYIYSQEKWTIENIKERTRDLVDKILQKLYL